MKQVSSVQALSNNVQLTPLDEVLKKVCVVLKDAKGSVEKCIKEWKNGSFVLKVGPNGRGPLVDSLVQFINMDYKIENDNDKFDKKLYQTHFLYHIFIQASTSQTTSVVRTVEIVKLLFDGYLKLAKDQQETYAQNLVEICKLDEIRVGFKKLLSQLNEFKKENPNEIKIANYYIASLQEDNTSNEEIKSAINCITNLNKNHNSESNKLFNAKAFELFRHLLNNTLGKIEDDESFSKFIDELISTKNDWDNKLDFLQLLFNDTNIKDDFKEKVLKKIFEQDKGQQEYMRLYTWLFKQNFVNRTILSIGNLFGSTENRHNLKIAIVDQIIKHPKSFANEANREEKHEFIDGVLGKSYIANEKKVQLLSQYVEYADLENKEVLEYLTKITQGLNKDLIEALVKECIKRSVYIASPYERLNKFQLFDVIQLQVFLSIETKKSFFGIFIEKTDLDKKETLEYLNKTIKTSRDKDLVAHIVSTYSKLSSAIASSSELKSKFELFDSILASMYVDVETKKTILKTLVGKGNLNEKEIIEYLTKIVNTKPEFASVIAEEYQVHNKAIGELKNREAKILLFDAIIARTDIETEVKQKIISNLIHSCDGEYKSLFPYLQKIVDSNKELSESTATQIVLHCAEKFGHIKSKSGDYLNNIGVFFEELYKQMSKDQKFMPLLVLVDTLSKQYKGEYVKTGEATIKDLKEGKYKDFLPLKVVKQNNWW